MCGAVSSGWSGRWLGREDVDRGARDAALGQGFGQGRLIDDPAAGDVDDQRVGLHGGQLGVRR